MDIMDISQVMRYLIERNGPVDLPCLGTQGPRPIHWACRKGHSAIVQLLLKVQKGGKISKIKQRKRVTREFFFSGRSRGQHSRL